jgi:hypothetical protein
MGTTRRQVLERAGAGLIAVPLAQIIWVRGALAESLVCQTESGGSVPCSVSIADGSLSTDSGTLASGVPAGTRQGQQVGGSIGQISGTTKELSAAPLNTLAPQTAKFDRANFDYYVTPIVMNKSRGDVTSNERNALVAIADVIGWSYKEGAIWNSYTGRLGEKGGIGKWGKIKGEDSLRKCAGSTFPTFKSRCGLGWTQAALYSTWLAKGVNGRSGKKTGTARIIQAMAGKTTFRAAYMAALRVFKQFGYAKNYEFLMADEVYALLKADSALLSALSGDADAVALAYFLVQNWLAKNPFMSRTDMVDIATDLLDEMASDPNHKVVVEYQVYDAVDVDVDRHYKPVQNIYNQWLVDPNKVRRLAVDSSGKIVAAASW